MANICIHFPEEEFIIDLSWISFVVIRLISDWIIKETEILLDHLYLDETIYSFLAFSFVCPPNEDILMVTVSYRNPKPSVR